MRSSFFLVFLLTFFCSSFAAFAQKPGDLWVTSGPEGWNIIHPVQKGETVFMLARRYHVPPAILADANGLTYNDGLKENTAIVVPLGAYNMQTTKPVNSNEARALYYRVQSQDNLYRISRHTNVSQRTLAQWNNLKDNEAKPGTALLVGWVLYDATVIGTSTTTTSGQVAVATGSGSTPVRSFPAQPVQKPVVRADTPKYVMQQQQPPVRTEPVQQPEEMPDTAVSEPVPHPQTIDELFKEQTQDGQNVVWEKGSAAFFGLTGQAKGAAVFAFHNKAAKGAVIRVKNMNNGRIVYVKVLGPLPMTKQYYNCIIGLSNSAKAALGVRDAKAFCELSYAGY